VTSCSLSLLSVIRADVEATTHPNYRLYSNRVFWTRVLGKLLINPNVRAVVTFRISHALAERGLLPLAMLLRARALRRSGAEIHPLASIGPGLHLVHSSGVVIGTYAVIGKNCRVHQGVTIGPPRGATGGGSDLATIGDDVSFGAGAVVMAGVSIGDGAVIGANAVVTKDVGPYEIVAGVPAKVVGHRKPDDPRDDEQSSPERSS
jgi:serine O-acetyltransferase